MGGHWAFTLTKRPCLGRGVESRGDVSPSEFSGQSAMRPVNVFRILENAHWWNKGVKAFSH